jgi:hypothetical protein
MGMRFFNRFRKYLPPGILVISLTLIYFMTLAPGLTWANQGPDGGDLITAAATGGVAHPTGYPVYLLLARFFQLLPIGSLAFRTNLMSAVVTVIAALLVYDLVTRFLSTSTGDQKWLAGLASAFAFGLSPLIWSQAVITEVYALHALFVTLVLYLSSADLSGRFDQKGLDRLLGFTLGLAVGNHVTSILLLPILLISIFFRRQYLTGEVSLAEQQKPDINSLLRRLTWLGMGLLVYISLPLRALSQPPVNWGNPLTLDGFGWLVSGKLYQDQLFALKLSSVWPQVQAVAALLVEQFGIPGLVIGLVGLVVFYRSSRLYRATIWIFFAFIAFAIIYATYDSYMYLIPAFLCFAIWIGLGVGGLLDIFVQRFRQIGIVVGLIFILYLFILAGNHWHQVDASHDLRAESFGKEVLALAPANAIVFAKGDKAIFVLWYFHYALHNRPDLAIVATDLLHFDWYQKTLHTNYPNLALPGPFPFATTVTEANPEHPVCFIEYIQSTDIYCLPAKVVR